ncbi:hypothetical protein BDW74DRAFT_177651 [Aspergillus multicolor]|uniref:uncharacterized protein n=1 Tax=Aspergillus multicolor TaxID=41759 RepID=UPI003CCD992A
MVDGATGISGHYMLQVLSQSPERWSKIYAVSRRPPSAQGIREGASAVDGVKESVDYVFFFAYRESSSEDGTLWGGQEQMVLENSQMLRDFVLAMQGSGMKRLVLQTGAKQYGVHIGPTSLPSKETDPRVETLPNFYHQQEDILKELGPKQGFDWVVVRPALIVGAVKGNFMNIAIAIGVYIAVSRELHDPIAFHGTSAKYHSFETFSSAHLNATFEEFCALTPHCRNEAYNIANGDCATWSSVLPAVAAHFNAPIAPLDVLTSPGRHPFRKTSNLPSPRNPSERAVFELRDSLVAWSQEDRVRGAWERLAEREGLDRSVFYEASWAFADGCVSFQHEVMLDVGKARRAGFHGTVNTEEDFVRAMVATQEMEFFPS